MVWSPGALLVCSLLAANPYLERGRALVAEVRYQEAEALLQQTRRSSDLSFAERREAYDLLARCLVALGRLDEAELIWVELLAADPDAPAPERAAPKLRTTFDAAKRRLYPPGFVAVKREGSDPRRLELVVVDPWNVVGTLTVTDRPGTAGPRQHVVPLHHKRASLGRPPDASASWPVIVEALDAEGRVVSRLGEPQRPLELGPLPEPMSASMASPPASLAAARVAPDAPGSRWLAWSATAAAAVLAGAGGALWAAAEGDYAQAGRTPLAVSRRQLDDSYRTKAIAGQSLLGAGLAVGLGAVTLHLVW